MNYSEAIDFLYQQAPMFQQHGKSAYKSGLETSHLLDQHYGHPHRQYKIIHVGGTNGKGSTSHLLASTLQAAGMKVGLYTSPHLHDFSERIRVDGQPIAQEAVVAFVEQSRALIEKVRPSFFEITTAYAFRYFADQGVDVAVVEVGLGGRLDCTNIVTPDLSVITNISFDHVDILGHTLEAIAEEKAGIIKQGVTVVIGETQPETTPIFRAHAAACHASIVFADVEQQGKPLPESALKGIYQDKNRATALTAIEVLQASGWPITASNIEIGFAEVVERTGLQGRWQQIGSHPTIVCDTGHNEAGIGQVVKQLGEQDFRQLHIVFGMVNDKKIDAVLALLPKNALYYFTKAQIPRALDEHLLEEQAAVFGLKGAAFTSVKQALEAAKAAASSDDFIFVGGSNFIVGEII